jgi:V8-like Glu-specific endopeptidase
MTRLAPLLALLASPLAAEQLPPLAPEDHAPWRAIGRVNIAGYSRVDMCTGTLIAPDQVLTAAHCVQHSGQPVPLHAIHFVAGWFGGTYAGHGRAREVRVHPQAGSYDLDVEHDLAVILLTEPMDIPPLPLAQDIGAEPYAIVGYFDRQPNRLSGRFDCTGAGSEHMLTVDCATRWGNSGGPILQRGDAGWEVVAVVSAGNVDETLGAWALEFLTE